MAINLLWIQKPDLFGIPDDLAAMRLSFLSAGVWWVVFSIPLFRRVPEPPRSPVETRPTADVLAVVASPPGRDAPRTAPLPRRLPAPARVPRSTTTAINTIIRMATAYGTEIGIARGPLIAAILMVQFVGVPFAFLFGAMADRIGAKRAIFLALGVYVRDQRPGLPLEDGRGTSSCLPSWWGW